MEADPSAAEMLKTIDRDRGEIVDLCVALGNLRDSRAAGELSIVFSDPNNTTEVRVAAMTALGQILQTNEASEAVRNVILAGTQESALGLRRASWIASSNTQLSFEGTHGVFTAQPPAEVEAYEAEGEEEMEMEEDEEEMDEEEMEEFESDEDEEEDDGEEVEDDL